MTMTELETPKQALIPFPGRMTTAQFDAERARLRGLYGESRKEAGARYEQALAKLYLQSGWTPVEIAAREGKGVSKGRVSQLLTFARFLWFIEKFSGLNFSEIPPLGLTGKRFSGFWKQVDKGEQNHNIRFKAVLSLMQDAAAAPKPARGKELGKAIAAQFADGKWRDIQTIAKQAGWPLS